MELPITKEEFDIVVTQLWKSRATEKSVGELYQKLRLVKDVMDENPDGPYKKILREQHGMVI
tara:strand:- start:11 stop:196 length:186 start_codon:yes stop_codon:yes gene_type:complete